MDEGENQINNLEHKEEINIQSEQQEETSIKNNKNSIRKLWDISKCVNIWIIGVPEEEEEQEKQEIENLFEQIMKKNFPNLVKEIDFQGDQEAQRVPKKLVPKRNTPRHITIKLPKIKDEKRILKEARRKERVTCTVCP